MSGSLPWLLELILVLATIWMPGAGFSQETDSLRQTARIGKITITGNRQTRSSIIMRELSFREGDTVSLAILPAKLTASKENLFNTKLFNFVTLDTLCLQNCRIIQVSISVVERWYIWPIPFLEISERNFNVWWETRDLQRLSFGIDLTFFNARGRNETLKILTHLGYNQLYGFSYTFPYIDKSKTMGLSAGAAAELNKETSVYTSENQPVYLRSNTDYLKKVLGGYLSFIYRPGFYSTHTLKLGYSWYDFDTLLLAVPGYLLVQQQVQDFVALTYLFKDDRRDVRYYPLKGHCIEIEFNHAMPYPQIHNSFVRANLRVYRQLFDRWYWAGGLTGKITFAKVQPYFIQRGLGYGQDYVRGYEYYVVDGQHYALIKNNLKFALLPTRVEKLPVLKSQKFNMIPVSLYVNAFLDLGYVYHYPEMEDADVKATNNLENRLLIGYGLGLDFATYYDFVMRVELSLNRMMEPGLYLHFKAPI